MILNLANEINDDWLKKAHPGGIEAYRKSEKKALDEAMKILKGVTKMGGPGSGHFGHASKPGRRGGSLPRGVAMSIGAKDWKERQQWRAKRDQWSEAPIEARKDIIQWNIGKFRGVVVYDEDSKMYSARWEEIGGSTRITEQFSSAEAVQRFLESAAQKRMSMPTTSYRDQGVVTGNDPEKIKAAIEGHAEANEFPIKVDSMKVVGDVPSGYVEMWHGTSRETADLIEQSGFKPSDIGVFGEGVYLAPGANKSIAYASEKYGADNGAMIRVATDPGKVLDLTPKTQQEVKRWETDPATVKKYRARLESARQMEEDLKGSTSMSNRREIIQKKYPEVDFEVTGSSLYPVWGKIWRVYAKANGYDSIRYAPPIYRNPIAMLTQPLDNVSFSNEELLILNPQNVQLIAIAGIKHE